MMRSGAIKGAGPFFSGREPDVPAIQSYPHAEANLPTRYPTHRKQRGGDYSRLATSVDAIELYAYGENIPIARSFNPELILLTTSFGSGPSEAHRVWRELIRGTRGLVL